MYSTLYRRCRRIYRTCIRAYNRRFKVFLRRLAEASAIFAAYMSRKGNDVSEVYASLILKGVFSFEDVPSRFQTYVREVLDDLQDNGDW